MNSTSVPIIVTRAEPGASQTAARLTKSGHVVLKAPAMQIEPMSSPPVLPQATDLVFTSANGVAAFTAAFSARTFAAWCVGPATAAAARAAGFAKVMESADGVDELAALVLAAPDPISKRFLHVANEAAAGDLVQQLRASELTADFLALYRTVPVSTVSLAVHAALDSAAAIVLIHSAKGAEAFLAAKGPTRLHNAIAVAISKAAAAPLSQQGLQAILLAERPNEDALMTALDTALLTLCKQAPLMPESEVS